MEKVKAQMMELRMVFELELEWKMVWVMVV